MRIIGEEKKEKNGRSKVEIKERIRNIVEDVEDERGNNIDK